MALAMTLGVALGAAAAAADAPTDDVTKVLHRQTQELFDAVTSGDSTVWDRYLAADVTYADEAGARNDKSQLLASIKPLPAEIWGKLEMKDFVVHPHGETAITTYTVDETEGYFGQVIHARYLTTDTWQRGSQGWRLIAGQVLALLEEPPAVELSSARLDEYVGVYALTPKVSYSIRREGKGLTGERIGRPAQTLKAEVADLFFVPGQPRLRKVFLRDAEGRITGFVERRESWDILWKRLP